MPKLIRSLCLAVLTVLAALPAVVFASAGSSALSSDEAELARALRGQYGGLTSWEAVMTFPDYPGVSVHLWQSRGRWRQEWTFPVTAEGSEQAPAAAGARAVGMDDRVAAACPGDGFALSPLVFWMPADPVDRWRAWGVNTAQRGYGFRRGEPCLLLGTDPGEASGEGPGGKPGTGTSPAVWLHNEDKTLLMFRYRTGDRMVSIDFDEYLTVGGFRLPGRVSVRDGGAVVAATVRWIAVNRADDEALYASDRVPEWSCAAPAQPFDLLRDTLRPPATE